MRYQRKPAPEPKPQINYVELPLESKVVYLDSYLDSIVKNNNGSYNVLVAWYLITSHLYYHRDISIISDSKFDWVCKKLLKHWKRIEHPHKKYIDKDQLRAGTGFYLRQQDLPSMMILAAISLHQQFLRLNYQYDELQEIYDRREAIYNHKQNRRYRRKSKPQSKRYRRQS